ncbi:MAG: precorrin-6x reductase [Frankiales bacterium]|nr:precorrin-6x reductase [Frankiales bacterium]
MRPARLLLLGGSTEGQLLAAALDGVPGLEVISSVAGRTAQRRPLPGRLRVGGFGGVSGLVRYLAGESIGAVVDATHPFAATMSEHAAQACQQLGLPLLRFTRPPWPAEPGDDWISVPHAAAAATALAETGRLSGLERVLVTTGRSDLTALAELADHWFLIRSIEAPTGPLPAHHEVLLDRGPYRYENELSLMSERHIQLLISKNSGGVATAAKLRAARALDLPVLMIQRPAHPDVPVVFSTSDAQQWVMAQFG